MRTRWIAAAAALAAAAPAAAGTGWTSVGSAKLDGSGAATAKLRWDGRFKEVLVCADGAAVKLGGATVRYRDGSTKAWKVRSRLAGGACLPELMVPRGREIESIDFAYDPASLGGATSKITLAAR
jgi:hypothetical protein